MISKEVFMTQQEHEQIDSPRYSHVTKKEAYRLAHQMEYFIKHLQQVWQNRDSKQVEVTADKNTLNKILGLFATVDNTINNFENGLAILKEKGIAEKKNLVATNPEIIQSLQILARIKARLGAMEKLLYQLITPPPVERKNKRKIARWGFALGSIASGLLGGLIPHKGAGAHDDYAQPANVIYANDYPELYADDMSVDFINEESEQNQAVVGTQAQLNIVDMMCQSLTALTPEYQELVPALDQVERLLEEKYGYQYYTVAEENYQDICSQLGIPAGDVLLTSNVLSGVDDEENDNSSQVENQSETDLDPDINRETLIIPSLPFSEVDRTFFIDLFGIPENAHQNFGLPLDLQLVLDPESNQLIVYGNNQDIMTIQLDNDNRLVSIVEAETELPADGLFRDQLFTFLQQHQPEIIGRIILGDNVDVVLAVDQQDAMIYLNDHIVSQSRTVQIQTPEGMQEWVATPGNQVITVDSELGIRYMILNGNTERPMAVFLRGGENDAAFQILSDLEQNPQENTWSMISTIPTGGGKLKIVRIMTSEGVMYLLDVTPQEQQEQNQATPQAPSTGDLVEPAPTVEPVTEVETMPGGGQILLMSLRVAPQENPVSSVEPGTLAPDVATILTTMGEGGAFTVVNSYPDITVAETARFNELNPTDLPENPLFADPEVMHRFEMTILTAAVITHIPEYQDADFNTLVQQVEADPATFIALLNQARFPVSTIDRFNIPYNQTGGSEMLNINQVLNNPLLYLRMGDPFLNVQYFEQVRGNSTRDNFAGSVAAIDENGQIVIYMYRPSDELFGQTESSHYNIAYREQYSELRDALSTLLDTYHIKFTTDNTDMILYIMGENWIP